MTDDAKALQLCSRFALTPNQLGYCGRNSAPAKFNRCIIDGDCTRIKHEITKFIVLYPYLKTIAEAVSKNWWDYKVVKAYWMGSDLLKQVKLEHYDLLLNNLKIQGVPDFLIEEMKDKRPREFIPLHLFNILHVGVGRASDGVVPFNLDSINNCMVRWGRVKEIKDIKIKGQKHIHSEGQNNNLVVIELTSLARKKDSNYKLQASDLCVPFIPAHFYDGLKVGEVVAVHWGWVVKKLNISEVNGLSKWTKKLLLATNS